MALIRYLIFVLLTISFLYGCKEKPREKKQVTKDMLLEMNKKMLSAEVKVIEQYIADNDLNMTKSGTGYYYQLIKPGAGDSIRHQDIVKVAYTTSLLDGTICYSSATDGFMQFTVGKAQVEAGLEQFIQHLQQGSIAKLILPPYLAHGIAGDGNKIPKLAIIIMDIEVVEVQSSRSLTR